MEKLFRLREQGTTVKTELVAGLTTFLTMSYIIFVNPAALSTDYLGNPTGIGFNEVLLATCLGSAFASIFMGFYARYPIALSSGMGENFYFVTVVMSLTALGVANAWQTALGMVFVAGLIFLVLSFFRVTDILVEAVSPSMRGGIAVGIGFFIAFIGLKNGGVIVASPGSFVTLNREFFSADIAVFSLGFITSAVLIIRNVRGAILWGILAAAILAFSLGKLKYQGIVGFPDFNANAFFQLDILSALSLSFIPFIIIFLVMDVFDTVGTLFGVAEQGGFIKDNKLPRANKVMTVDAAGTIVGAVVGTSTITSFIESTTGIAQGGRTGLVSVVVGLLFLLALFFSPFIGMIGMYAPVTAPALLIVGAMMLKCSQTIDFDDLTEYLPAFICIVGIPLSYSIADGIALGFVCYPILKILSGRGKEVHWLMYVLAVLLLAYFLFVRSGM